MLREDAVTQTLRYFEGEALPADVFLDKYALRDQHDAYLEATPDDMHWRLANELARIEKGKFDEPYTAEYLFELMKDFGPIIPQGSPMYAIGNPQYVTSSNCYVVTPPCDSFSGIHFTDEELSQISKRRGGVGTDVSLIRPNSTPTTNAARRASGVVGFCERFSNSIREVGQNGRRGALLLSLSVHHPEILDFTRMKLDPTKVTGANVSVRLTDEFLNAVLADAEYEQRWPVEGAEPKIRKMVRAREVWNEIIRCAHARAEPGLLFWDNIIKESPADCYAKLGFNTVSTNPCSELPLCAHDSCRLLLLNLFAFVDGPFGPDARFDFAKFYEHCQIAQRLMDDIVDLELECIDRIIGKVESDPEPDHIKARELWLWREIKRKCAQGRRTGTGITALADAMAAVGIRYGSDDSIEFTEQVYKTLKFGCYASSVEMARQLGPFPIWNKQLEADCPFLNRIKHESLNLFDGRTIKGEALFADMQRHGRRNIALLTTAPAGSVSIVAGPRPYFGTSSGIEPLFTDIPYTRRKKITPGMENARVDFIDELGDRWSHFEVFHSKLRQWMDVTGETDWTKSPYHGCTANDLDWKQRVKLQAAAQKHVCHAISATVNLPNDVSEASVAEIYETAWKSGCKGITVYRDGCRSGVLIQKEAEAKPQISKTQAPKRPPELPCELHHLVCHKTPFVVVVGILDGEPFEVFAFANNQEGFTIERKHDAGFVCKVKRKQYELLSGDKETNLLGGASLGSLLSDTEEALTRMVSTALRHGADIAFVTHQLEKVKTGDLHTFAKVLARALKKYIKEGTIVSGERCEACDTEGSLVRAEGCCTCRNCGASKCG